MNREIVSRLEINYKMKYCKIKITNDEYEIENEREIARNYVINHLKNATKRYTYFKMDRDMKEPIVFHSNITIDMDLLRQNLRDPLTGSVEGEGLDLITNQKFTVKRLKDKSYLKNYDIKEEGKEIQNIVDGLCICGQDSCICHRKFPHPDIGDNPTDADECPFGCSYYIAPPLTDGLSPELGGSILDEMTMIIGNIKELNDKKMKIVVKGLTKEIRNCARMIKTELEKEPENIIIRERLLYLMCDPQLSKSINKWNNEEDKDKLGTLEKIMNIDKVSFNSSWASAILGIIDLLYKLSEIKDFDNSKQMLFDQLWFEDIKSKYQNSQIGNNQIYSTLINETPELKKIDQSQVEKTVGIKDGTMLQESIKNKWNCEIMAIRNFPILLSVKGIQHFVETYKASDFDEKLAEFKVETRVLILFESQEKLTEKKRKLALNDVYKYCLSDSYSYVVYSTPLFENISLRELRKRKFTEAYVCLCTISNGCKFVTPPIVHPKLLMHIELREETKQRDEERKRRFSDELSDQDFDRDSQNNSDDTLNESSEEESDNNSSDNSNDKEFKDKNQRRKANKRNKQRINNDSESSDEDVSKSMASQDNDLDNEDSEDSGPSSDDLDRNFSKKLKRISKEDIDESD